MAETMSRPIMTDEHLARLWLRLSDAAHVQRLDYPEAVTIGNVFGEMSEEIRRLRRALSGAASIVNIQGGITKEMEQVNARLREALEEVRCCIDSLYGEGYPRKLHQELVKYSGPINVMDKVTNEALSGGESHD